MVLSGNVSNPVTVKTKTQDNESNIKPIKQLFPRSQCFSLYGSKYKCKFIIQYLVSLQ